MHPSKSDTCVLSLAPIPCSKPQHFCRYLKYEVRAAIKNGEIEPPNDGTDDFLGSDQKYGPSIYTVTEQHIKPVTECAGKMSWALMRSLLRLVGNKGVYIHTQGLGFRDIFPYSLLTPSKEIPMAWTATCSSAMPGKKESLSSCPR